MTEDVPVVVALNDENDTAYVYNTADVEFLMKLKPFNGSDPDRFRINVAVYDDTIVVGAEFTDDNG